jgi:hypothetical protein
VEATGVSADRSLQEQLRQVELALRPSEMGARIAAALGNGRLEGRNGRAGHFRHDCHILDVKYRPGKVRAGRAPGAGEDDVG